MTGIEQPAQILLPTTEIGRQNINNHTGMNTQGPIMTTIPESSISNNFGIFDLVKRTPDIAYRGLPWYGTKKSENENLRGNKIFENTERRNNSKVEKIGRKIL